MASAKKIGCYARLSQKKYYTIPESLKLQEIKQEVKYDATPLSKNIPQNQQLITYNPNAAKISFIRSQMGTGKTKQLLAYIDEFDYVVSVSFRISFAVEFA